MVAWAQKKNQKAKFNCVPGWAKRPGPPKRAREGKEGPGGGEGSDHARSGWQLGFLLHISNGSLAAAGGGGGVSREHLSWFLGCWGR